ncbi:hypothetical protein DRO61_10495, partial [Candidatus Bathyarchaeota archaeon]
MKDKITLDDVPKRDWRGKKVKKMKGVSPEYQTLVFTHKLTKEKMLEAKMMDTLRAASKNGYAERCLRKHMGMRPLPLTSNFYLYPHQVKCLTWLREREDAIHYGIKGGIIALEMGLGKTTVAMAHTLISPRPPCKEKHGDKGFPTLVVCSKTVMQNWKLEKEKFFGDRVSILFLHRMYLGKAIDHVTREFIVEHDMVVTTYDVINGTCKKGEYHETILERGDDSSLQKGKVVAIHCRRRWQSNHPSTVGRDILYCTPWERVILDESHKIANPASPSYKYAMALYGKYKICLSGTPVPNYCFVGDTRVITNKGNISIRNLVRLKQTSSLRILSYNKEADVFEYKKLENGWELKANDGLVQIAMGKKKITCTPNHEILTVKGYPLASPEYVEAKHLTDEMYIVHYTEKETRSCAMNILNADQEQVVIGSYLGGGHLRISDHYRTSLHVSHSETCKEYSEWKANIFQTKITERKQSAPGYTHTN